VEGLRRQNTSAQYASFSLMMPINLMQSIVIGSAVNVDMIGSVIYRHPILCSDIKEELLKEAERLKVSIEFDLEIVSQRSKIKYYSNPTSHAPSSDKHSILFIPMNDDDRDAFVDLLADQLILRRMSPTGELEELRQCLF
jgi:hypothetical protein